MTVKLPTITDPKIREYRQKFQFWAYCEDKYLVNDTLREMNHVEHSGFRWLQDHGRHLELPGVLPDDEDTLRLWARMTKREWNRARAKLLKVFVPYHDQNGVRWLIDEQLKGQFYDWCYQNHCTSMQKQAAANTRYGKNATTDPKMQVYAGPYHLYAKEVSNKLTSTQQSPIPAGDVGDAGSGGDGDGEPVKLGTMLRAAVAASKGGGK